MSDHHHEKGLEHHWKAALSGADGEDEAVDTGRRRFLGSSVAGLAGVGLGGAGLAGLAGTSRAGEGQSGKRYQDKVVLITGATSGIGEATAHAYAQAGARVYFCGRREERGEAVEAAIRDDGGKAWFIQADVREASQVRDLVKQCVDAEGRLDIAFNNAGIEGPRGGLDEIDLSGDGSYQDVMKTNVDGVLFGMRYEIPVMREQGSGVIVNTGSMLSHRGSSFAGAYAASKHAVIGLTRSAASREAGDGVRVISVSPGGVETDLLKRFMGGSLEGAGENSPMGRIAQPSEVADVVLNLTAPEALFLNGDDVKIDGASSA
ncbi:NAD(P)-dependent dehydrogenase (short-subunit alcohol dehydrogenase family) [Natronospira proteinivora]|uniref:NAD(P)-dependent dehydrogenase (Short-subunit alcohol dehydrogenase family) n=1 Tax=Natronospira proteinivora TaxID=1807133 RepID=A0ABT1G8S7_9GAMM|nr:SDR family NAD(P)-dependent oxidoreductase [Natronospira proteinivora]MCP1727704.1 NAD(P)-dependent dehydrogenase (short-subunit alcohol dehydrogenase family) [Natronospira proteinivora]